MDESAVNSTTMRVDIQRYRWMSQRLPGSEKRRIVVLTGARQTGKTTLSRRHYPDLRYINLDAIEQREALRSIRTAAWGKTVGMAIIDEAQKEPSVFDKVKYAFDEGQVSFTVLLGSSRILLLNKVRESLAGRSFLYDLWPLMPSEITHTADEAVAPPLLDQLLEQDRTIDEALAAQPQVLLGADEESGRSAIDHLSIWGGMPALLQLDDYDRREWLRSYQQTFLERDLADLARLTDLHPFRTLQKLAMLRSGQLLSYSDISRDAQIAATTARRYLEYLSISYQVLLLRPYSRNLTSAVIKTPKLYWIDLGILRQGTRQWGPITGHMFETLVVCEVHKWIDTMARDASLYFYRTRSGLEVDLIVQTANGIMGIEIKNRKSVHHSDKRNLAAIARSLGDEWLGGLVVYGGQDLVPMDRQLAIWAMPVHRLFQP